MTDWLDEIAAVNAVTRNEVRQLIDRGLSGQEIVASLGPIFEVDFGEAEPVDPMLEVAKAVLALAGRESVVNVTVPPQQITVSPASLTVPPATVTVNVPKAEPVVNVKATLPAELKITGMPDRVTSRKVERDKEGRISRTLDIESDA